MRCCVKPTHFHSRRGFDTNGCWKIDLRRAKRFGRVTIMLRHQRALDRNHLLESLRHAAPCDLGAIRHGLTQRRSLVVQMNGDPQDAVLHAVEQNDFHLNDGDVYVVAEAIYRRLSCELFPRQSCTSDVIDIHSWLRDSCEATTASRIERILSRNITLLDAAAKEHT